MRDWQTRIEFWKIRQATAKEANPKIRAAAVKAVEADASLADGHMVLASVKETEWTGRRGTGYKRAVELNPGLARLTTGMPSF